MTGIDRKVRHALEDVAQANAVQCSAVAPLQQANEVRRPDSLRENLERPDKAVHGTEPMLIVEIHGKRLM